MKTVIFDIDGTLCTIDHRLHHIQGDTKDWDAFYAACVNDVPKHDTIELLNALMDCGYTIVLSTGRSEDVRGSTEDWLTRHGVFYDRMYMRPSKSYVPDTALKKAWLDNGKFGPKEDILMVVEDRDTMVQMWRGTGLTCLQVDQWVEEGHVSFPLKKAEQHRMMELFISDTNQQSRFGQWKKNK